MVVLPISIKMFLQFSVSLLALAAIVQATAIPSLNMLERRLADIPLEKRDAGGVSILSVNLPSLANLA